MSQRNPWAAASGALLLLAVLAGCAAGSAEPQPTAPTESPTNEVPAETSEVEVFGRIVALSDGGESDFRQLHVPGQGYLPLTLGAELHSSLSTTGVVVAVPDDFDGGADPASQFAALQAVAESSGEPLVVLRVLE